MSPVWHFDHVGITVRDLDTVAAFFAGLGFETEGRAVLEGDPRPARRGRLPSGRRRRSVRGRLAHGVCARGRSCRNRPPRRCWRRLRAHGRDT